MGTVMYCFVFFERALVLEVGVSFTLSLFLMLSGLEPSASYGELGVVYLFPQAASTWVGMERGILWMTLAYLIPNQ